MPTPHDKNSHIISAQEDMHAIQTMPPHATSISVQVPAVAQPLVGVEAAYRRALAPKNPHHSPNNPHSATSLLTKMGKKKVGKVVLRAKIIHVQKVRQTGCSRWCRPSCYDLYTWHDAMEAVRHWIKHNDLEKIVRRFEI